PHHWNFSVYAGYVDGFPHTAPVGSFPRDVSPTGALDMVGNVREICRDVYDATFYARSPRRDPVCTRTATREQPSAARRGTSWSDHSGWPLVQRSHMDYTAYSDTGFRVAFAASR